MIDDLKMIKKMYGEDMMHLCRELFPTILETPGVLYSLIEKSFAPNHYLYEDIWENALKESFRNHIYSLIENDSKDKVVVNKNPYELMEEAGYTLYECKSEEDIQEFKKYYTLRERLCTFNGGRLDRCYVFFAVKKNIDEIRREDFSNPDREDEYGTSVISIQFTRGDINTLSIKNRYNHTVVNPDATYSNNLDNIIPGLSASFEEYYGLNINQNNNDEFEIPGYVRADDGKYYKYNYEINNIYYCLNNIIIDNFRVIRDYQEKEKYIIADYFIIDLVKKEVRLYDERIKDSFIDGLHDIKNIRVIKSKDNDGKTIIITPNEGEDVIIEIDKYNRIIGYKNNNLVEVGNSFLEHNEVLENLELSNLVKIKNDFLYSNRDLINLCLPKVEEIGGCFLYYNLEMKEIDLPSLKRIGNMFMYSNYSLVNLKMPNLLEIGSFFLERNNRITDLCLPSLVRIGDRFLFSNQAIKRLQLPNLEFIGKTFLCNNLALKNLDLPKLIEIGSYFMESSNLYTLNLPSVRYIGDNFLLYNNTLRYLSLENLEVVGSRFMCSNNSLRTLSAPNLVIVGDGFLYKNTSLRKIDLPILKEYGEFIFHYHKLRWHIIKKICGKSK